MDDEGFCRMDDVLASERLAKLRATVDDVHSEVAENGKQRFAIRRDADGVEFIRANQGHSIPVPGLELRPIVDASLFPTVVHGTYFDALRDIVKSGGLRPMTRCHIHFAVGLPSDEHVISGMRSSCQVLIFIDLARALADGVPFFLSANNVVLCAGVGEPPTLSTAYFARVTDRSGVELPFAQP